MSQTMQRLSHLQLSVLDIVAVVGHGDEREITDAYNEQDGQHRSLPSIQTVLRGLNERGLVERGDSKRGSAEAGKYRLTKAGEEVLDDER